MDRNRDDKYYVVDYDDIMDTYIPGKTMPPVENEWRYRYSEYCWMIELEYLEKDMASKPRTRLVRTYHRPLLRGNLLMWVWEDEEGAYWKCANVTCLKGFSLKRYETKVMYKIDGMIPSIHPRRKDKIRIKYMRETPIQTHDEDWFDE